MPRYWLFKSEPDVFSIQDLSKQPGRKTCWEGVRNYQARNLLRDEIHRGDGVLFYHSRSEPMVVAGSAEVIRDGYPDHFAQDPAHHYYDEKATAETPIWFMVDIRLTQIFPIPVTRSMLQEHPVTAGMMVLKRGSRLSVQPVSEQEWRAVHALAGVETRPELPDES